MKEFEMFGTNDLFDEKNLKQVCSSIHALGRLMQTPQWSHLTIPKLGIKVVEKNVSFCDSLDPILACDSLAPILAFLRFCFVVV